VLCAFKPSLWQNGIAEWSNASLMHKTTYSIVFDEGEPQNKRDNTLRAFEAGAKADHTKGRAKKML
jgi:hypothetical protein